MDAASDERVKAMAVPLVYQSGGLPLWMCKLSLRRPLRFLAWKDETLQIAVKSGFRHCGTQLEPGLARRNTMSSSVLADFVSSVEAEFRPLVERLAGILQRADEPLDLAIKWRRLTFVRAGDFHHWICSISVTKSAVNLNFHFGGLLRDPDSRLVAGSSRFLRKLEFRSIDDLDESIVLGFVNEALLRLQYFKDSWKAIQAGDLEVSF